MTAAAAPTIQPVTTAPPRRGLHAGGLHIPALDGVRGLAILMVMMFHLYHAPQGAGRIWISLQKVMVFGQSGVDLFFVLSGFLITGILLDAKPTAHYFRNFYARRTLRIFPLYYLVLTCAAILGMIAPDGLLRLPPGTQQLWFWLYVSNIGYVTRGIIAPGLGHFWSLAVEEQFYLVWPTVVRFCNLRVLSGITIFAFFFALGARWWFASSHTQHGSDAAFYLTFCRIDALAVGALIACAYRSESAMRFVKRVRLATIISGVVAVLAMWALLPKGEGGWNVILKHSVLAILFGGIVAVAGDPGSRGVLRTAFEQRWLRLLGKYSYGLYVYHGVLRDVFVRYLPVERLARALHSTPAGIFVHMLVGILVSLAVAFASWHLYEAQWLKLKKYFEYRSPAKKEG